MDSDKLLRAYQEQERRFVERRFPLRFAPEIPPIRELYNHAKALRWNPETDVAWGALTTGAWTDEERDAARLTWSRRAWGTYPGLGESTSLLLRFCLESGSTGMDAKLFLSLRPAEEAKHLEACYLFAERLGGYVPDPGDESTRRATNHPFAQMALDPDVSIEAYVAALGCLDDQLDLNLYLSHLQHATHDTARHVLRQIAGDKARHVTFAWVLLSHRVPALDAAARATVGATVRDMLDTVILQGYRNAWLLPGEPGTRFVAGEAVTAARGLGASTVAQEQTVLRATVRQLRERLAGWDITLPAVSHPELGTL